MHPRGVSLPKLASRKNSGDGPRRAPVAKESVPAAKEFTPISQAGLSKAPTAEESSPVDGENTTRCARCCPRRKGAAATAAPQARRSPKESVAGPGLAETFVHLLCPCLRPRPSAYKIGAVVLAPEPRGGKKECVLIHYDPKDAKVKAEVRAGNGKIWSVQKKSLRLRASIAIAYQGFTAGASLHWQILNNIRTAWYHVCRSAESNQLTDDIIYSASEGEYVCNLYDFESEFKKGFAKSRIANLKGVAELPEHARGQERPLVNFVVWRRSALYVLAMLYSIFVWQSYGKIHASKATAREYAAKGEFDVNFTRWAREQVEMVPCSELDTAFEEFLSDSIPALAAVPLTGVSMIGFVPPQTCGNIRAICTLREGSDCCGQTAEYAITRYVALLKCGWSVCSKLVREVCPHACLQSNVNASGTPMCEKPGSFEDASYLDFSKEFVVAVAYRLRAQSANIDVLKTYMLTGCQFMELAGVLAAVATWSSWRRSWIILLSTWVLTFFSPFFVSAVPSRLFTDWGTIDTDVLEFLRLTKGHYNIEEKAAKVLGKAGEVCNMHIPDLKEKWETVKDKVQDLCGLVQRVDIPMFSTDDSARQACKSLPKYLDNSDKGVEIVLRACDGFNRMFDTSSSESAALQEEIYEVITEAVANAKLGVEVSIGFASAMSSFSNLWPTAISLAPGLIKAALRAKVIVPEASIPGIFVILLPWLYTPLTWAMYNILTQLVGNTYLLVAVVLYAFYPMAYSFIGAWYKITSPMEAPRIEKIVRILGMWTSGILLVAVGLTVGSFVEIQEKAEEEDQALVANKLETMLNDIVREHLTLIQSIALMVLSFVTKLYLTTVTGVDWMLRETADQRLYETLKKDKSKLEGDLEGTIEALDLKRKLHLDGLVILNRHPAPQALPDPADPKMRASDKE